MLRRTKRTTATVSEELRRARDGFARALDHVEEAKAALVSTVRAGRMEGMPLAEGLAEFDAGLSASGEAMPEWRLPEVEPQWRACEAALREARARAEHFRMEAEPRIYEDLIGEVEQMLDPLEPFEFAARRFKELGL